MVIPEKKTNYRPNSFRPEEQVKSSRNKRLKNVSITEKLVLF